MKMKQRKTIGLQQTVFHFAVYMRTENEMRLELHLFLSPATVPYIAVTTFFVFNKPIQ